MTDDRVLQMLSDKMDEGFTRTDSKIDKLDIKIDKLDEKLHAHVVEQARDVAELQSQTKSNAGKISAVVAAIISVVTSVAAWFVKSNIGT